MKLSIITINYNDASGLAKTLKNVANWHIQAGFELEHIVIDGSSTDDSVNIIKQYHHLCSVFEMIVYGFPLFSRENITIMGARSRLICSFQASIISPCLLGIGERFRRSLRQNLQFFL